MEITAKELFNLENEKKIVQEFWKRYDLTEIIKLMVVTGIESIIDLQEKEKQEIDFIVGFEKNGEESLKVKIEVTSYEGRTIQEYKTEGGEFSNEIINEAVSFQEEMKKELKIILTITSANVMEEVEKTIVEKIKDLQGKITEAKELVLKALEETGELTFAQMEDDLKNKRTIFKKDSLPYSI
jgi:hypothetical protein